MISKYYNTAVYINNHVHFLSNLVIVLPSSLCDVTYRCVRHTRCMPAIGDKTKASSKLDELALIKLTSNDPFI